MPVDPIARLQSEHQQMKTLLEEISVLLAADSTDTVAVLEKAAEFETVLSHHERCEEDILFPALQGMGPVQLVLQEHQRLAPLREAMNQALGTARTDDDADNIKDLALKVQEVAYCLSGHFMKEERLIFPMAMASLTMDQLAKIGQAMNGAG